MKVLITGGSGLIGSALTTELLNKGVEVSHVSRKANNQGKVRAYSWDELSTLDSSISFNAIVHLAGANVGEKRWSSSRKELIIASRVNTAAMLFDFVTKMKEKPSVFVCASGISCYENGRDEFAQESSFTAEGFLADVVHDWELSADRFLKLGLRVVKFRTGLVLAKDQGVLEKMSLPVKLGIGSPLGSGNQSMPWVHIQDMVAAYVKAIEDTSLTDVYNLVADNEGVSNKKFTQSLAKVLHRPLFMPNVPGFVLKLIMGEMAELALEGVKVSNKKIKDTGFKFQFSKLDKALQHLYA